MTVYIEWDVILYLIVIACIQLQQQKVEVDRIEWVMQLNRIGNNRISEQIWQLSLLELLRRQRSLHTLTAALSKSRNQILSPELAIQLQRLIQKEGQNWVEVARRLTVNNYGLAFEHAIHINELLPILIIEYHRLSINDNKYKYALLLWDRVAKLYNSYWDHTPYQRTNTAITVVHYAQSAIAHKDTQIQQNVFSMVAEQPNILRHMLTPITHQIDSNTQQGTLTIWNTHRNAVNLMLVIVKLVGAIEHIAMRNMWVARFQRILGCYSKYNRDHKDSKDSKDSKGDKNNKRNNNNYNNSNNNNYNNNNSSNNNNDKDNKDMTLYSVISHHMTVVVQLISTMPTLLHKQNSINSSSICNVNRQLMGVLQVQQHSKLSDYFSDLWKILLAFADVAALQVILSKDKRALAILVNAIRDTDIVKINRYANLSEELIAVSYQISSKIFSDTLSGTCMRTIISLCTHIGAFFSTYIGMLWDIYNSGHLHKCSDSQLISYLLKVSLLSDGDIIRHRQQDIQPLLLGTTKQVSEHWEEYSDWQKIQILRYFLVFVGTDQHDNTSRAIGYSQSGQQLISKCIQLCLLSLSNTNTNTNSHTNNSHTNSNTNTNTNSNNNSNTNNSSKVYELNKLQQQCYDILLSLPQSGSILRIIKHELLGRIVTLFLQLPNNQLVYLQLFNKYMTNIPQLVHRSCHQILQYYYHAYVTQIQHIQHNSNPSTKRIKSSHKLLKILQAICIILDNSIEIRYDDIQQYIVQPIVSKLYEPQNINYQQQLLNILDVLLTKHHHLTPQIVMILSKLPLLYEKNNKKLSILRNIYVGLTSETIKKQILYQYPDMVSVMLNMFIDYSTHALSIQQFMFYTAQTTALLFNIQAFVQVFAQRILEDQYLLSSFGIDLYNNISKCISNNKQAQHRLSQLNTNNSNSSNNTLQLHRQLHQILMQFIMTITHICIAPHAHSFNAHQMHSTIHFIKQTPVPNYLYRQTLKMIPIIFVDQLIINPQPYQPVLDDIIKFCQGACQLEIQGGINKNWKTIHNIKDWELWPTRTRDYIQNVLREMRNRRLLQQIDHAYYLNALSKYLR